MKIFTPYRICPLGAHVDHQHGIVTGFALDHGVYLEYAEAEESDMVRLSSVNFSGEVSFCVREAVKGGEIGNPESYREVREIYRGRVQ